MDLNVDNLNTRINANSELVVEPSFIGFLRSEGYIIESVRNVRTVPSDSEKAKAYLVVEIETYTKPRDDPELDYAQDEMRLLVCSCWSYRENSELNPPQGTCKHCSSEFKTEKAKNDEQQQSLV